MVGPAKFVQRHFENVTDPRAGRGFNHGLLEMVFMALTGVTKRPVVQVGLKKPSLAIRTVLLVQIRMDLVCDFHQQRQVFASKTLGTSPFISFLVEGGELDLGRSVVAVLEDGGFLFHSSICSTSRWGQAGGGGGGTGDTRQDIPGRPGLDTLKSGLQSPIFQGNVS